MKIFISIRVAGRGLAAKMDLLTRGKNKLFVVQSIQGKIDNEEQWFYNECIFKLEMKQQENIVSHECTSKSSNTFKVPFSG